MSSSLSPFSEKHILSFISLTFHCLSNDQHLDRFGILLKTFWSLDISGCFTYYGVHDLSKHTGEWNSIHMLLPICVHEHRFLQTTFHHDLGKNILLGVSY